MYLVSACLLGKNCKYNGGNNLSGAVCRFLDGKEYVACCPEQDGGLSTPRVPAERRGNRVINRDGLDVTEEFTKGAENALRLALEHGADTAILKERSPSCGVRAIYDGSFTGTVIPGCGLTAQLLAENGLRLLTEEDIENLSGEE